MNVKDIDVGKCYLGEMTNGLPFVTQITRIKETGMTRWPYDCDITGNIVFFLFTKACNGPDNLIKSEWLLKEIDEDKYSEIRSAEDEDARDLINKLYAEFETNPLV